MKSRIVVIGSKSFVGSSIIKMCDKSLYKIVEISRDNCDLSLESSQYYLNNNINDNDIIIFVAAKAPCKDFEMFQENIKITHNVIDAIRKKNIKYLLNISSDAIYSDSDIPIIESSKILPDNPHGIMHFHREKLLDANLNCPIGHIRPTLIYGKNDPHNGYGPNKFLRTSETEKKIEIFGNGEEKRDHIHVDDVAKICICMLENFITKPINAVTGQNVTFLQIAELIKKNSNQKIEIIRLPRKTAMPHNGYRVFSRNSFFRDFNINMNSIKQYIENFEYKK